MRAGTIKVRSGCRTCKLRKVKCDESRPHCMRCKTARRNCAGYDPVPAACIPWVHLLTSHPPRTIQANGTNTEKRYLDFFLHVVAPFISGSPQATFWTHLVPQVISSEPAARHAVLSITSLYETFQNPVGNGPPANDDDIPAWKGSSFSLGHYNHAIHRVLNTKHTNLDALLVISILFTCIELLQGNAIAALKHCQHGIAVFTRSPDTTLDSDVAAVLRHLSIFPLFFGADLSDLPQENAFDQISYKITTWKVARELLDIIMARTVRLIRSPDPTSQQQIRQALQDWMSSFVQLWPDTTTLNSDYQRESVSRTLKMRWLACKVWTEGCMAGNEMIYDNLMDTFQEIVDLAQLEADARLTEGFESPKFLFEMGLGPLLDTVVLKCRSLRLRLAAFRLMQRLACPRETLWDLDTMVAIGRRIIQLEHGIHEITAVDNTKKQVLPPNESRIRDSMLESEVDIRTDSSGSRILRRKITVFYHDSETIIRPATDWISFSLAR